jgi:hypothetical protein
MPCVAMATNVRNKSPVTIVDNGFWFNIVTIGLTKQFKLVYFYFSFKSKIKNKIRKDDHFDNEPTPKVYPFISLL